jgi:hypothetical protein
VDEEYLVRSEIYQLLTLFDKFLGSRRYSRPGDAVSGILKVFDEEFDFAGFSGLGRVGFKHLKAKRTLWVDEGYEIRFGMLNEWGDFLCFTSTKDAMSWVRGK